MLEELYLRNGLYAYCAKTPYGGVLWEEQFLQHAATFGCYHQVMGCFLFLRCLTQI